MQISVARVVVGGILCYFLLAQAKRAQIYWFPDITWVPPSMRVHANIACLIVCHAKIVQMFRKAIARLS